ncbi:MAG: rRNA maturation RNase YbeY [Planctomycetota bacterium]|jgi:rRNA maturation RNase YbeY
MGSIRHNQVIAVQVTKRFKGIDFSGPRLKKLVSTVCKRFGLSSATVSIAVVDEVRMRALNREFLNLDRSTDCLSFDLSDERKPDDSLRHGQKGEFDERPLRLFELIVNGEKAVNEAEARAHAPQAELALYVTHALLHQLGFDDSTRAKAKTMHRCEDEILQHLGYGLVYNSNGG